MSEAHDLALIVESTGLSIDLAYAGADNFLGRPVYAKRVCALRKPAAEALARAAWLARERGLILVVRDAFRPAKAQRVLWDAASDKDYVADPMVGSNHTRGVAVDMELADGRGKLDMGSPMDEMGLVSAWASELVDEQARKNRLALRDIMLKAGFEGVDHEWWHFQLPKPWSWDLIGEVESRWDPMKRD